MKIPIKHAIDSDAWFKGETEFLFSDYLFRFRVLSFDRIRLEEVDNPHNINLDEGILWLMKIEFVNLNKKEIAGFYPRSFIILMDQDDFIFCSIFDDHLSRDSEYATTTGLRRFVQEGPLLPKIKIKGAIAFLLPDGYEKENIYLSVTEGDIQEV